jgi:hypothetical protein
MLMRRLTYRPPVIALLFTLKWPTMNHDRFEIIQPVGWSSARCPCRPRSTALQIDRRGTCPTPGTEMDVTYRPDGCFAAAVAIFSRCGPHDQSRLDNRAIVSACDGVPTAMGRLGMPTIKAAVEVQSFWIVTLGQRAATLDAAVWDGATASKDGKLRVGRTIPYASRRRS